MVASYDYLATMAWDVAMSGILLAIAAILLRQEPTVQAEEKTKKTRMGFAVGLSVTGSYLFITGLAISLTWPYPFLGGVYNVLFGGIATIGGLVLLAGSIASFLNADLRPVTYLAVVAGVYSVIDAYAIVYFGLTDAPLLAALGYLSFAAPAFLSVPVAHSENKMWRWLFVIFTLLFAAAWLYQAANFTIAHLQPS